MESARKPRQELEQAARIAQASEFINRMEDTATAKSKNGGNNFSGGQKQRMSIPHGVVSNPNILIQMTRPQLWMPMEKLGSEALEQ